MKIALFGGSFNPIHNAHIKLAERFFDEVGLDYVYFIPTFITPLKDNSSTISAKQRLDMCNLALKDYISFKVADIEVKREGMSYSCDTIAYFRNMYPDAQLYFIMGADMFFTLEKWNDFKYIFKNVTILTAPRDDDDYTSLCHKLNEYKKYNCKAHITKEYIEDLSSTMIRDMISKNIDVSAYLNKNVIEYIKQNDLYR
ncbi:MAG: nicotinate (nicotinamide) nucleotide adenylyltransferase [Ruminococcaceae bacterium]|nr:nicotinate (nicotinamide) nucleotide adenylyltransferase [Oscillospiraceae bacterium]